MVYDTQSLQSYHIYSNKTIFYIWTFYQLPGQIEEQIF
jgi:hypothetical protein